MAKKATKTEAVTAADNESIHADLKELEAIVERVEQNDVPLDDAMKEFGRAVELAKSLKKRLKTAQLQIEELSQDLDTEE